MVSSAEVKAYLASEAKFLGQTALATAAGGIVGSVVAGAISLFTGYAGLPAVPFVSGAAVPLGAAGATLGFATGFVKRMLA